MEKRGSNPPVEVEDGVDFLSTVEGFRGGNFTHALRIQGLYTAKAKRFSERFSLSPDTDLEFEL